MPLTDCGFPDNADGLGDAHLERFGPTLHVNVGFDPAFDHETSVGAPNLSSEPIRALVDTGASQSGIDDALAARLQLPVVDRMIVSGIGGEHEVDVYLAQIFVPSLRFTDYGRFNGVALAAGGQPHSVLIGRTFLHHFVMIYDGLRGQVTLAI